MLTLGLDYGASPLLDAKAERKLDEVAELRRFQKTGLSKQERNQQILHDQITHNQSHIHFSRFAGLSGLRQLRRHLRRIATKGEAAPDWVRMRVFSAI
ncbi:hypothetical protein [Agrobacterium tumefaciens]|uniref:hypothetical protein n=1 Tax=Agrobacterium tumefaciens TaxID=358 RepID=UPI003B9EF6BB